MSGEGGQRLLTPIAAAVFLPSLIALPQPGLNALREEVGCAPAPTRFETDKNCIGYWCIVSLDVSDLPRCFWCSAGFLKYSFGRNLRFRQRAVLFPAIVLRPKKLKKIHEQNDAARQHKGEPERKTDFCHHRN
ncbi:MAG: hypothetical protein U0694_07600 [Anaerolineae bacterium]